MSRRISNVRVVSLNLIRTDEGCDGLEIFTRSNTMQSIVTDPVTFSEEPAYDWGGYAKTTNLGKHTMKEVITPAIGWHIALAAAIRDADDNTVLIVDTEEKANLAELAVARMGKTVPVVWRFSAHSLPVSDADDTVIPVSRAGKTILL
jgi:hypothetical protein